MWEKERERGRVCVYVIYYCFLLILLLHIVYICAVNDKCLQFAFIFPVNGLQPTSMADGQSLRQELQHLRDCVNAILDRIEPVPAPSSAGDTSSSIGEFKKIVCLSNMFLLNFYSSMTSFFRRESILAWFLHCGSSSLQDLTVRLIFPKEIISSNMAWVKDSQSAVILLTILAHTVTEALDALLLWLWIVIW